MYSDSAKCVFRMMYDWLHKKIHTSTDCISSYFLLALLSYENIRSLWHIRLYENIWSKNTAHPRVSTAANDLYLCVMRTCILLCSIGFVANNILFGV